MYITIKAETSVIAQETEAILQYSEPSFLADTDSPTEPHYDYPETDVPLSGIDKKREYWPLFENPIIRKI